jgi:protein TonB
MITRKNLQVSLKTKYPLVLKESLIITLLMFITAFYFNQEIVNKKGKINIPTKKNLDIVLPEITINDIAHVKRPATPIIPIEASGEDGLNITDDIFKNLQGGHIFDPVKPPTFEKDEIPHKEIPFWALDTKPEPIGGYAAIQKNVVYPEMAQEIGLEGTVVLKAYLDTKGNVIECIVLKGIENTGLNEAAIDAVMKTKFTPAMQRDQKVGVWMTIPIIFKLR